MRTSAQKKPPQPPHYAAGLREQLLLDERNLLYQKLMRLAVTDVITGLPNHQAVITRLEEAVISYKQTGTSCALLFLDLDHFKRVNDSWGHRAGDELLHAIAQRVRAALRPQDFVGRYGGEEFLILLPGVDVQAAMQIADYVRSLIGSLSYCWQPADGSAAVAICTTVSIGVAIVPLHGTSADTLLEEADQAMYQAKYTGGNRVYPADVEMTTPQFLHHEKEYLAVRALTAAVSVHDRVTHAHGQRLVHLITETARQLKRPEEEIHLLRLAALLHDIGKIGVPEAILHKPGPLTQQEWAIMHQHPEIGCQLLEQVGGVFRQLVPIVGTHHERWDGQGYPNGLAKEAIPMSARILAVVDAYDAMISPRPYRQEPLTTIEAITELQRSAGGQCDPHVVEAFLSVLAEQENQPGPLVEATDAGTPAQFTPVLDAPTGNGRQSVTHMREQMTAWREQLAELQQQQVALQQRIEALQQNQQYLAWQKQERVRQRQELFAAASSNLPEENLVLP